ncbi:MAG: hypothetical protein IJT04_09870 [Bacteroidales bacterium]|nr:hypothetical protein [Bacteroidales bacterium]
MPQKYKLFPYPQAFPSKKTLTAGTSTSCSVNIGDQTSKLPVISFATSNEDFTGEGVYTAFFLNKAALVKFDVNMIPIGSACLMGMNNKVTVDFSTYPFQVLRKLQSRLLF